MDKKELQKAQNIIDVLFYDDKVLTQWQHTLLENVISIAQTKLRKPLVSGSSLPRLFVAENQEFVIEGQIFTWYFSNKELRQGIVLNRKGVIEPQIISVTKVAKNFR